MERPEANPTPSPSATDTPPAWALDFCRHDMEHLRQFVIRFQGANPVQHPPLAGDRLVAQARHLAERYPDADAARASAWLGVVAGLTDAQRLNVTLLGHTVPAPEPADHPFQAAV